MPWPKRAAGDADLKIGQCLGSRCNAAMVLSGQSLRVPAEWPVCFVPKDRRDATRCFGEASWMLAMGCITLSERGRTGGCLAVGLGDRRDVGRRNGQLGEDWVSLG